MFAPVIVVVTVLSQISEQDAEGFANAASGDVLPEGGARDHPHWRRDPRTMADFYHDRSPGN
jgi:hypothetical protein